MAIIDDHWETPQSRFLSFMLRNWLRASAQDPRAGAFNPRSSCIPVISLELDHRAHDKKQANTLFCNYPTPGNQPNQLPTTQTVHMRKKKYGTSNTKLGHDKHNVRKRQLYTA